jgi:hypothetical protein
MALGIMKIAFVLLAIGMASASGAASTQSQEFLSWYNGWGTHTVWGIGKVSGSYLGTTVKCGATLIPVRVVYDSHAERESPQSDQTSEFLQTANVASLRRIESIAGKCNFESGVK